MELGEAVIGFILGLATNVIVAAYFSYRQFTHSTAGFRVRRVAEATRKIVGDINEHGDQHPSTRIPLRNKYKYSLGVMLDDLGQSFGTKAKQKEFNEQGDWPRIIESRNSDKGRWERFNEHVRPVIDDINGYVFLGGFSWLLYPIRPSELRQLQPLMQLCNQLEIVAGELDALFEHGLVEEKNGRIFPTRNPEEDEAIKSLRDEYRELYKVWHHWLGAVFK